MKRPAWAAAGSFAQAWSWLEQNDNVREASRSDHEFRLKMLKALSKARVVTIDVDQARHIPIPRPDDAVAIGAELRLPFPTIYLSAATNHFDIGAGPKMGIKGALVSSTGGVENGSGAVLGGALTVAPFGWPLPNEGMERGLSAFFGVASLSVDDRAWALGSSYAQSIARLYGVDGKKVAYAMQDLSVQSARFVVGVLSWLESVNVELTETPLSKKQRAREVAKGRDIALTVRVRAPKTKRGARRAEGRNFSHRFEVAGHYMHFPEGTKVADADPSKLSFVPGRGFVRKVWCPPHVKGPEDKPLIPKVRVVDNAA